MLLLLVLCWGLAHLLHGAASRAYGDGRAAISSGAARAGKALRSTRSGSDSGLARGAASAALGTGYLLGGLWRAAAGTGRSLWLGGREGWQRGRRKALRRMARARIDRRRNTAPEPEPAATADPKPEPVDSTEPATIPEPAGGDGAAASTNPTQPEPTTPTNGKDPDMSTPTRVVGEAVGMSGARQALAGFAATSTMYLDVSERAKADAAAARGEAASLQQAAEQLEASMAAGGMDSETLGEVAALREHAAVLESCAAELERWAAKLQEATEGLLASTARTQAGLQARHGVAEEAIKSTRTPAKTAFYQG